MYGAIIGDLAGSIYEYDQTKGIKYPNKKELIEDNSFFSDDTILTIAILDAIKSKGSYEEYLKKYIKKYKDYRPDFEPYFKTSFSPRLIDWSNGNINGNSIGNGALMRISPVGYMFYNEADVIKNALYATIPTHNSEEAIYSATAVALIIFYLRKGLDLKEIYEVLQVNPVYKEFTKFNKTCYETLNNCLYILYNSNSFEESIINAVNMGGDTDTNACIVGSMAEALYGVDYDLKNKALERIPSEFVRVLRR